MPFGVYIHFPFCTSKCNYCSFVSALWDEGLVARYLDALTREIASATRMGLTRDRVATSVYFGGGTPTLMGPSSLGRLLSAIKGGMVIEPAAEISLEATPAQRGQVAAGDEQLGHFREAGVNRLTIGIQSFDDNLLAHMGRRHNCEDAVVTYERARRAGFTNVGIDLIFGLPGQSLEDWRVTLEMALGIKPDHISAYSLTVEEGTHYGKIQKEGGLALPDEGLYADMFIAAREILTAAGYRHYEVSNYALPGHVSRHNMIYWDRGEYLGLGVAAHSFLKYGQPPYGLRASNYRATGSYIDAVEEERSPRAYQEFLSIDDAVAEALFLNLRTDQGIDMGTLEGELGVCLRELLAGTILELEGDGLVRREGDRVTPTIEGMLFNEEVVLSLLKRLPKGCALDIG